MPLNAALELKLLKKKFEYITLPSYYNTEPDLNQIWTRYELEQHYKQKKEK